MPTYYRSTERKPGRGIRKSYRHGGRNRRDEEARVIGVQDNAADELRRVRGRRPKDAREVRDRRAQLARVGSRERNARDEMRRLRGYQMGGGIDSLPRPLGLSSMMQQQPQRLQGGFSNPLGSQNSLRAAQAAAQPPQLQDYSSRLRQGRVPPMQPPRGMNNYQRMGLEPWRGQQGQPNIPQGALPNPAQGPTFRQPQPGEAPRTLAPAPPNRRYVPDQTGTPLPQTPWPGMKQGVTFDEYFRGQQGQPNIPQGMLRSQAQSGQIGSPQQFRPPRPPIDQQTLARMAAAQRPRGGFNASPLTRSVSPRAGRGIAPVQRGSSPKPWFSSTQRPEYLPETQAQFFPWARGGRVGLKKGGRIPRKKGAKFI